MVGRDEWQPSARCLQWGCRCESEKGSMTAHQERAAADGADPISGGRGVIEESKKRDQSEMKLPQWPCLCSPGNTKGLRQ